MSDSTHICTAFALMCQYPILYITTFFHIMQNKVRQIHKKRRLYPKNLAKSPFYCKIEKVGTVTAKKGIM